MKTTYRKSWPENLFPAVFTFFLGGGGGGGGGRGGGSDYLHFCLIHSGR